jgi:hypothetical protein
MADNAHIHMFHPRRHLWRGTALAVNLQQKVLVPVVLWTHCFLDEDV